MWSLIDFACTLLLSAFCMSPAYFSSFRVLSRVCLTRVFLSRQDLSPDMMSAKNECEHMPPVFSQSLRARKYFAQDLCLRMMSTLHQPCILRAISFHRPYVCLSCLPHIQI